MATIEDVRSVATAYSESRSVLSRSLLVGLGWVLLFSFTTNPAVAAASTPATPSLFVANSGSNSVSVIDATSHKVTATIKVGLDPFGVAVSPNGSTAYVLDSGSGRVSVIDTSTETVVHTIVVGDTPVAAVFTGDGRTAYVANSGSNSVSVINTAAATVAATVHIGGATPPQPYALALSPGGSLLYVANVDHTSNASSTVSVIDTAARRVVRTFGGFDGAEGVALSPNGAIAYVANVSAGTVSVDSTATGALQATVPVGAGPQGIVVSKNGSTVYVVDSGSSDLAAINATTLAVTQVAVGPTPVKIALSPSGAFAYVADFGSNSISVIDTGKLRVVASVPVGVGPRDVSIALLSPSRRSNIRVSTISLFLPTIAEAFSPLSSIVVNGGIAAAIAALLTFPSQLFNDTFHENFADISEWWKRRRRQLRRLVPRPWRPPSRGASERQDEEERAVSPARDRQRFVFVLLVGGLIGTLNDPGVGLSMSTLVTYLAVVLAITAGTAVPAVVAAVFHSVRHGSAARRLHAIPAGLGIAAGLLVFSRLVAFEPGYIYGVVCAVVFARHLSGPEKGRLTILTIAAVVIVSVLAWIAWVPLSTIAQRPGAFVGAVLAADLLAAMVVSGLVGAFFSLLPLNGLPGFALKQWNRAAWAACFGLTAFGVCQILLRPGIVGHGHRPLVGSVIMFFAFGVASVAFHEHFENKERRLRGESSPGMPARLRAILPHLAGKASTGSTPKTSDVEVEPPSPTASH